MLKTTSQSRRWIGLAAVLWLVILAGIIFIPQSRSDEVAQVAPTNSLSRSLQQTRPGGDVVTAQLVDPSRIYDPERYLGYTTLCPGEPQELVDAKLEAFGLNADDLDLGGDLGYVLLIPANEGDQPKVDGVELNKVDICTVPQSESFPLNTAMPFHMNQGRWTLGMGQ
ncbi:hypothetical protein GC584_10780 [Corynebacterium sp. zg912]|uniref:Uncharacterized protein n=1 Tax=Corynebacterium wankanglinii TaxID=2735136 RepID=A0A7H0KAZ8_9CORY|nr:MULTISPECIES: hypothetical protein [Corynebacterium]MBA1836783.1 hypothetical protein [Corynebacterium wankanglinii]MCR5929876.1 hypothetical protein [Corynebacterium sp. zg912]QNP94464.1 hypothetical protein IA203_02635 [Corynebacterium wankanglinii]